MQFFEISYLSNESDSLNLRELSEELPRIRAMKTITASRCSTALQSFRL